MRVKLDENIGRRGVELLKAAGHDVLTFRDQGLGGARDERLFGICRDEARTLVTLDHDFGQVLRFLPEGSAGLVVLEPGRQLTPQSLMDRLADSLWIIEPGRVRVHLGIASEAEAPSKGVTPP